MQPRRREDSKKRPGGWLLMIAVLVASSAGISSAQPNTASADQGKQLFMAYYCYSCHGTQGHGGAGPRIVVGATADAMIRYVRKPTGGNMPAYTSKSISDAELRDIHAYLRSIPASPPANTIELLKR